MKTRFPSILHPALACLFAFLSPTAPAQDGIYADFATARGTFTARLDFERAPKAVAAFVGLATGEKNWLDPFGNVHAATPFYDGTLFHRVLPGLAIQGGGLPSPSDVWVPTNYGPATLAAPIDLPPLTTNLPPGVSTIRLGTATLAVTSAPAIPLTVMRAGEPLEFIQTNRTRVTAWMVSTSAGPTGTLVQSNLCLDTWLANATTQALATNLAVRFDLRLTNSEATPAPFTISGFHAWSATNVLARHSVATNFANAGFYFPDNVTNGLRHVPGTLSMARSLPNTDGSQFFVCVATNTAWDGNYTVFGHVVAGLDVVEAIASVPVDAGNNDRPLDDQVLERVTIRRVGAAAGAFDIHAQGLPRVDNVPLRLDFPTNGLDVTLDIPARSEILFRWNTDLARQGWGAWETNDLGYFTNALSAPLTLRTPVSRLFCHASSVTYPIPWTLPATHRGRTFVFRWTNTAPETAETLRFPSSWIQKGAWTRISGTNAASGEIFVGYDQWTRFPYSAAFSFWDSQFTHAYQLRMDPGATTGTFTGRLSPLLDSSTVYALSGTFTVSP